MPFDFAVENKTDPVKSGESVFEVGVGSSWSAAQDGTVVLIPLTMPTATPSSIANNDSAGPCISGPGGA